MCFDVWHTDIQPVVTLSAEVVFEFFIKDGRNRLYDLIRVLYVFNGHFNDQRQIIQNTVTDSFAGNIQSK